MAHTTQSTLFSFFKVTKEKRPQQDNAGSLKNKKSKVLCEETSKKTSLKNNIAHKQKQKKNQVAVSSTHILPPKLETPSTGKDTNHPIKLCDSSVSSKEITVEKNTVVADDITTNYRTDIAVSYDCEEEEEDIEDKKEEYKEEEEEIQEIQENNNQDEYEDNSTSGLSEYEKLRLERIRQNSEYLSSLGLDHVKPTIQQNVKAKPKSVKRSKKALVGSALVPVRRSTRQTVAVDMYQPTDFSSDVSSLSPNKKAPASQAVSQASSSLDVYEEDFEDSDVLTYLIAGSHEDFNENDYQQTASHETGPFNSKGKYLKRLKLGNWRSFNEGVKTRWYAIHGDKRSGLIVAGGQGGRVSTFRMCQRNSSDDVATNDAYVSSLFSFKPHGSTWVSDVLFCGDQGQGQALASLLLTSANDGNVMLWDMTKQSSHSSAPKLVNKSAWHNSGIWSMHSSHGFVATGSKDTTVSLGTINAAQGVVMTRNEELNLGHVKCVNINTSYGGASDGGGILVAAACEEGSVMILDSRGPQAHQGRLDIKQAHGGRGCMSVEWRPDSEFSLLSAGLDATIKVWDIRKSGESLHVLSGHVPPQHAHRLKQISRPRWLPAVPYNEVASPLEYEGGDAGTAVNEGGEKWGVIAVQGEHTTKLTLYDAVRGSILSRGDLESAATTLANIGDEQPLVAVGQMDGTISFLGPDHA